MGNATMRTRWASASDGPYIHIDDVVKYLNDTEKKFSTGAESSRGAALLCSVLSERFTVFAAATRKERLDTVASVAPAAIDDLRDLMDELGG